ncbi:MAG: type II secretion system F family protein [Sphingomonadaceae bacterium]|nr:type II secretion system F family protein [Sphingomonadaceae bacterium]
MDAAEPMTIFGLSPIDLATMLAALATIAVMVAVWAATTVRDPMRGRVKALQERREQLKAGISTSRKRGSVVAKAEATDVMRSILKKLAVLQDEQTQVAATKLAQAGIRSKDAIVALLFARLVMPLFLGGGMLLAVYVFHLFDSYSNFTQMLIAGGSLFGSYKAPDLFVQNLISKRSDAIRKGLPDALDLLVICAEAGLTVDAAFSRVARELGAGYPELGDEFALTSIELGFLTDRRQAFDNLSHRVALDSIRGVVTTMVQTEKYGTPLASALRVLSAEFRNERMMRAEEKAARLPAIMTIPLILFILPVLFVVILGPAACSISDSL